MNVKKNKTGLWGAGMYLVGVPLAIYLCGFNAERTVLKEVASILTVVGLVLVLGQFLLARTVRVNVTSGNMGVVRSMHIVFGYIGSIILLAHPFLIIVPRYFEAGLTPYQAFITIISTRTPGITTGLAAWGLLLVIAVLSFLRRRIFLRFTSWRRLHGLLSAVFIIVAVYHGAFLGRHMNQPLTAYIVIVASTGLFFLLRTYISELPQKGEKEEWILSQKSRTCPEEVS